MLGAVAGGGERQIEKCLPLPSSLLFAFCYPSCLLASCPPYGRGRARANSQVNSDLAFPKGKQWASSWQASAKRHPGCTPQSLDFGL